MKQRNYIIALFLLSCACPVMGQAMQVQKLSSEDYHLWSTLQNGSLSPSGKWITYSLSYKAGKDTLSIKERSGSRLITIPSAQRGTFISDDILYTIVSGGTFQLWNLKRQKKWEIANTEGVETDYTNKVIILARRDTLGNVLLDIRDLEGNVLKTVKDVISFSIDPGHSKIAYSTSSDEGTRATMLYLKKGFPTIVIAQKDTGSFNNFEWAKSGAGFAFVYRSSAEDTGLSISHFKIDTMKYTEFALSEEAASVSALDIPYAEFLALPPNGEKVVFTSRKLKTDPKQIVEVWNAGDNILYPRRSALGEPLFWSQWEPATGHLLEIGTTSLPYTIFTADCRFAICYNGSEHTPSFKRYPDRDCYIMNLQNGKRVLMANKVSGAPEHIIMSPVGNLIAYKEADDWIVYNPVTQQRTPVSRIMELATVKNVGLGNGYQFAAWADDGKSLLLYDTFDIWQVTIHDAKALRLTNGWKNEITYRLAQEGSFHSGYNLLSMRSNDYNSWGYSIVRDGRLEEIVYCQKKVASIQSNSSGDVFTYTVEKFDQPPALMVKGKKESRAYASNLHFKKYGWGRSELIEYATANGQKLKGVLCYPFNFNPDLKYPMIVHIYERQNYLLHQYINPTFQNGYGFNTSLLASEGYFVFFPDISYEIGSPGKSALNCVMAATEAALQNKAIDPMRMGLLGHSYGGYETNFIIGQTNLFNAAISGAAVSDYMSSYFTADRGLKDAAFWRFERDQRRMGSSFFEDKNGYLENSPVFYADNITTPLLQFTGTADTQVDPAQNFEFHLAFRRLHKQNILLAYPGEGHVFRDSKNKEDLTIRILEWFGHFLKGGPIKPWMVPR